MSKRFWKANLRQKQWLYENFHKIKKLGHPQIVLGGLGQILFWRSYWGSKRQKMLNHLKSHTRFWPFLATFLVTVSPKIYTIGRMIIIYKICSISKKIKMKIVTPPPPPPPTPTPFSTVPWSGLRRRQKYLLRRPPLVPLQEGRDGEVRCQDQRQRRQQQERGQVPHLLLEVGARLILEIQNWLVGLLTWKGKEASSRKNPAGFIPFLVSKVGRRWW